MAEKEKKESSAKERKGREGIPCSPESLAEWEQTWKDMEESINNLYRSKK